MKKCLLILFLAYSLSPIANSQDVQRLSERQIIGTARYVGMGGAMTAIGGDPSAVIDNPAGLGLYRRDEIMLTLDETIDNTTQPSTTPHNSPQRNIRTRFSAPNVSAVWARGNSQKQRGMIFNNFMLSVNRLANFNRDVKVKGQHMGMIPTICMKTDGLAEQYLQNKPWNDNEIGWLSILGYETYLINPIEENMWEPAVDLTDGTLSISETGSLDQYTFSWGGNISNQWYVGMSLNIPTVSYTKRVSLYETNRINSAELKSLYYATGVGVSGTFGLIYRPAQWMRVGASIQTPVSMAMSVQTEGDMYTTVATQSYELLTPESGVMSVDMVAPLRSSVSVAAQLGSAGFVALQYDYAHAKVMDDVHTLRVGAETQVYRGVFLNMGYVYESSFLREEPVVGLDYNSIRTDMDYRYTPQSQYASVGFGYRSDMVVAQLAYQYRWQTLHQYASENQLSPIDVNTQTHRIVATLAWRFNGRAEMAYDNRVEQYTYVEPRKTDLTQVRKY